MPENTEPLPSRKRGPGRPWPKGVSPNPGGRPKAEGHVRDLARQHTAEAIETLVAIMRDEKATDGARVRAAECLLARGWGLPTVVVDANLDGKIEIAWLTGAAPGLPGDNAKIIDAVEGE